MMSLNYIGSDPDDDGHEIPPMAGAPMDLFVDHEDMEEEEEEFDQYGDEGLELDLIEGGL